MITGLPRPAYRSPPRPAAARRVEMRLPVRSPPPPDPSPCGYESGRAWRALHVDSSRNWRVTPAITSSTRTHAHPVYVCTRTPVHERVLTPPSTAIFTRCGITLHAGSRRHASEHTLPFRSHGLLMSEGSCPTADYDLLKHHWTKRWSLMSDLWILIADPLCQRTFKTM